MDNSSKNELKVLSTLRAAVDENTIEKWTAKSASQRYKQEIEKLNTQMDMIIKVDNKRIDHEIKELTLQRETLENVYKTLKDSLHINTESLVLLKVHQEYVSDQLKSRKERGSKILNDCTQHYEKCQEKLAKTNATYKILAEKRAHLKRIQFNIKKFEHELKEMDWRKNYVFNIRQKYFYDDYVSLAKAWLDKRDHDEGVKKKEEIKKTIKQLLKEHMEQNVKINEKKKINMNKKIVQNKQATNNKLQKLICSTSHLPKIVPMQRNIPKTPVYFLNDGLVQQNNLYVPPKPLFNTSIVSNKQTCISKPSEKIKILEDKLVSFTKKDSVVTEVDTMTKEEKRKAVHAKMQKFVENFKARKSSQNCKKSNQSFHVEKSAEVLEQKNEAEVPPQPSKEMAQSHLQESGAAQELANLNILSQDANVVNMFSQESGKNVQTSLNKFKYDPVTDKKNFEIENDTFDNSNQGKVNSSVKDFKTNVQEPLARKINFPGIPDPINFPDKLSGPRIEMNLKNQQFKDFNEKTGNNRTPNKINAQNYFKAPNDGNFGRNASISLATGPKTAIPENKFNVQNEKNSATNNINEYQPSGSNVQNSTENQSFQINMPFSMGAGTKTAIPENKFNVQNEKNSATNNVDVYPPFSSNVYKLNENQNFQMNMPFSMGAGTSGYKPQPGPCTFDQSVTFKRPKLDNRQGSNIPDLDKQGVSMIQRNIGSQNTDNMPKPNDIQYNFGNITQFMDNSITELGDLNATYDVISPDFNSSLMKTSGQSQNPETGISFSGTDFAFDQPTDVFTFNFN